MLLKLCTLTFSPFSKNFTRGFPKHSNELLKRLQLQKSSCIKTLIISIFPHLSSNEKSDFVPWKSHYDVGSLTSGGGKALENFKSTSPLVAT